MLLEVFNAFVDSRCFFNDFLNFLKIFIDFCRFSNDYGYRGWSGSNSGVSGEKASFLIGLEKPEAVFFSQESATCCQ